MNTFGNRLRLTTFGESHGAAMGGVLDGFPSGFKINFEELQKEIDKRKPGTSSLTTPRKETDKPEFLSGINPDGITLGTPIGFIVRNNDHHSSDYDRLKDVYRPNHADFTYLAKYGIRDHRGGGRSSARETLNWVIAGALCCQWLKQKGINIDTALTGVGKVSDNDFKRNLINYPEKYSHIEIPADLKSAMQQEILNAKKSGDSVGGLVSCLISGLNPGIGSPIANKLHAALAAAMMSINAAKGFEYGLGFDAAEAFGSEVMDKFIPDPTENSYPKTETNYSGGIQGGISNGMPVFFSVAFKPTPTLGMEIYTINTLNQTVSLKAGGRHDPCVAVRAVPVVKALAALVISDFLLGC